MRGTQAGGTPGRLRRAIEKRLLAAFIPGIVMLVPALHAQDTYPYHDDDALSSAVREMESRHGNLVQVLEVATTPGGTAVRAVRLGAGEGAENRPALLVVAGAYGPHLVGTEVALHVAQSLASRYGSDSTITRLLDRITMYLVLSANPDAAAAFFERPQRERTRNASPYDDDRDAEVDEDGPEDLDGNGLITMMRVLDPAGEWLADPENPELMRKADPVKGEIGSYRVYVEGIDNDGDEAWKEDPPGGIDVNRNLPYGYEFFPEGAGLYPVEAPEARGIAQFYLDHPNIAAVYVLGPQDNLLEAWEHERERSAAGAGEDGAGRRRSRRPLTSVLEVDEPYFAEVARTFREITGLESGPSSAPSSGDVLGSAYYDMGRWSFGSRAWWIPTADDDSEEAPEAATGERETAEEDSAEAAEAAEPKRSHPGKAEKEKDPLEIERRELRWLRENVPGSFVDWVEVSHPDFPDRTVEVGGFAPFARLNPPASELDSVLARQERFIVALAGLLPSVTLRDVEVESLSDGVYRIKARVANEGFLPTLSGLGELARWPRRVRVEVVTDGQEVASGQAVQLLGAIPGSGQGEDVEWVLIGRAGSRVTIRASSPVAGQSSQTVTLR
jgi:hypothetical protein